MKIGLIGDSQGDGLAPHVLRELTARGHELAWQRTRAGISTAGAITDGYFDPPAPLDLAIVVIGGNDTGTSSYERTLREALTRLKPRARTIVWIGPASSADANVDARHRGAGVVQRDVLGSQVTWISGPDFTRELQHAPDGVHFTRTAYQRWAERLVPIALEHAGDTWTTRILVALGGAAAGALLGALAARAR